MWFTVGRREGCARPVGRGRARDALGSARRHLRARDRWREERGQVLAIAALVLPVVLGMGALAISVGLWFETRQEAQNAADAAALAGAKAFSAANPDMAEKEKAKALAKEYVEKNIKLGEGGKIDITTPYGGSSSAIQVKVTTTAPGSFASVFNITSVKITASAAAKSSASTSVPGHSAVFAYEEECGNPNGIFVNGKKAKIEGAVHSNGQLKVVGNEDEFGPTTYGGPKDCEAEVSKESIKFRSVPPEPVRDPKREPWPINYETTKPPCQHGTLTSPPLTWKSSEGNGIFCAEEISVNEEGAKGEVTFYAKVIHIIKAGVELTPYWGSTFTSPPHQGPFPEGLIAYAETEMKINGKGFSMGGGAIFAPNGPIKLTGAEGEFPLGGFIEGLSVKIEGQNFTFKGTGPACEGCEELVTESALIE